MFYVNVYGNKERYQSWSGPSQQIVVIQPQDTWHGSELFLQGQIVLRSWKYIFHNHWLLLSPTSIFLLHSQLSNTARTTQQCQMMLDLGVISKQWSRSFLDSGGNLYSIRNSARIIDQFGRPLCQIWFLWNSGNCPDSAGFWQEPVEDNQDLNLRGMVYHTR